MNTEKGKLLLFLLASTYLFLGKSLHASECGAKADCGFDPAPLAAPLARNTNKPKQGWEICNKTKYDPINVSIGYKQSGSWHSKGSIFIYKNKCTKVLDNISNPNLYYLVRTKNIILRDEYSGSDVEFCIRENYRKEFQSGAWSCEKSNGFSQIHFDNTKARSDYLKTLVYR